MCDCPPGERQRPREAERLRYSLCAAADSLRAHGCSPPAPRWRPSAECWSPRPAGRLGCWASHWLPRWTWWGPPPSRRCKWSQLEEKTRREISVRNNRGHLLLQTRRFFLGLAETEEAPALLLALLPVCLPRMKRNSTRQPTVNFRSPSPRREPRQTAFSE